MATTTAQPTDGAHTLGEGPVWDADRGRLLWVDIQAGAVHAGTLDDGAVVVTDRWVVDETVGAVVPAADGRLLVAGRTHLHVLRPDGVLVSGPRVVPGGRRLNDGACDPAGRFLVGSLALDDDVPQGTERLVRLERDGTLTVLDDDLVLSNGLAWSPDGTRLYSVDSGPGRVHVRDYDAATGATGARSTLLEVDGTPDGLTTDADGNLWVAVYGAGQVRCLTPEGTLLHTVEVDAPATTSVAFAGPDLDVLVITTAREGLGEDDLAAHPESGRLFLADVRPLGVRGLPAPGWDGRGLG